MKIFYPNFKKMLKKMLHFKNMHTLNFRIMNLISQQFKIDKYMYF